MISIDVISDIHIEDMLPMYGSIDSIINSIAIDNPSNSLIIAGDISKNNKLSMDFLKKLQKFYKNIIITYGNHDLYIEDYGDLIKYSDSYKRIEELKNFCLTNNIHFLDGNTITIDNIVIGGLCYWYSLPKNLTEKEKVKLNRDSSRLFMSSNKLGTYWNPYKKYISEKYKFNKMNECDILVTHVPMNLPTLEQGLNDEHLKSGLLKYYFVDDFDLVESKNPQVYIHGHAHLNFDYIKNNIRVVCNPLKPYKNKIKKIYIKEER